MPRTKSGEPRKQFYRRHTNWPFELAQQAVTLIRTKRIYFPYSVERNGQINAAGLIQGVIVLAAEALGSIPKDQWKTQMSEWASYMDRYDAMTFAEEKGFYLDDRALAAFEIVKDTLKTVKRENLKAKMGAPSQYPLVITVSLLWFIHHNQ